MPTREEAIAAAREAQRRAPRGQPEEPPRREPAGRPGREPTPEELQAQREEERRSRAQRREISAAMTDGTTVRAGPPTVREMLDDLAKARLRVPELERLLPQAAARVARTAAAVKEAEAAHAAAFLAASRAARPCAGQTRVGEPRPGEPLPRERVGTEFPVVDEFGHVVAGEELGRLSDAFNALPEDERRPLVDAFNALRAEAAAAWARWNAANTAAAVAEGDHRGIVDGLKTLTESKIPGLLRDIDLRLKEIDRGLGVGGDQAADLAEARRAVGG
jgi:hypothetical protein